MTAYAAIATFAVLLDGVPADATSAVRSEALSFTATDTTSISSARVLALLPDGSEKRKLILDCTGCHQLDAGRAFADGEPRSAAEWEPIVQQMLQFAGVGGPSPLISPGRAVGSTAEWLAANLRHVPQPVPAFDVPEGAEITPFAFPYPEDLPHDIAVDAEGGVVVTGMFTHRMARLDPSADAGGSWQDVAIPVPNANPRAIEIDGEGRWWVLLGAPGKIARHTPGAPKAEAWDSWDIGMYGHSIRLDDRGGIWFNGHFTRHPSIIGVLDSRSERVETFEIPDVPAPGAEHPMPYGLRVAPDGRVWGTELRGNRLFALSPDTEEASVYVMPEPHSGPRRPAVDPEGRVWIPEYAGNRLTRFDPASEEFTSYDLPVPDALPYVAEFDRSRGLVWLGTAAANAVFSFDPGTGAFTAYPMPTEGALIRHLVVDERRGDVWAAYGAFPGVPPLIVRIRPEAVE